MNSHATDSNDQALTSKYDHAIVIGSSIAGMTAARVLLDHFQSVTIIERDRLPEGLDFRKGVPHARHPHALLVRGQMILEQLFPGLSQQLIEAGGLPINMGAETNWWIFGQQRPTFQSDLVQTACSRPLIEGTIRQRLFAHPRLRVIQEAEVAALCVDATGKHVTGVRLHSLSGEHPHNERELRADLVVDASGRTSRAPEWLAALGYTPPQETVVNARPGYATRIYQRPANFDATWKMLYIQPIPGGDTRGAIIIPMEGDRWHVTMIGMAGDYPPTDEQGFLDFARSLPTPVLYEAIKDAQPLTTIYGYRRAENRLRHYDQLPRYLEGFVVTGDAAFAFNPVYGQGMTVAAMGSMTLDGCLRQQRQQPGTDLVGLARTFQTQLAELIAGPWQMATGEDQRWLALEGQVELDPPTQMMQAYLAQFTLASLTNPVLADAFYHVMHMVESPAIFFRPDIVLQVFASLAAQPAASRNAAPLFAAADDRERAPATRPLALTAD
jgi:2-polyprenyl-6-methoxyphenol hydroxylase-like FAD-dependent oxidoreductase